MKNKSNGSKSKVNVLTAAAIAGSAIAGSQAGQIDDGQFDSSKHLTPTDESTASREARWDERAKAAGLPLRNSPQFHAYKQAEHEVESMLGMPADTLDPRTEATK